MALENEDEYLHLRWSPQALHHPILRPIRPHNFAQRRHGAVLQQQQRLSSESESDTMPTGNGNRDSLFSDSSSSSNGESDNNSNKRPEAAPLIHALFEELTETWQYVVADPITRHAVIIDPHLDNAPSSTTLSTIAADRVLSVLSQKRYYVDRILHTHESKHLGSSAWYIRAQLLERDGIAPRVTVGRSMAAVQRNFRRKYSMRDGTGWRPDSVDNAFSDGQEFMIGSIKATTLHFRNGTQAFVIGQNIFAGKTSMIELELRNRNSKVLGDLRKLRIYTSKDDPPQRKARLVPVYEGPTAAAPLRLKGRSEMESYRGRKLVIKYAAENEDVAELEG